MVDLWFANMSVTRDHMPWSPQYTQRNQGQKRCNTDLKFHMWWFKSGKTSISCPETSSLLWFMTMTIQKCVETGWNLLGSWPVELMVGTFGEPLAQPFGMKMVRCHKATGMVGRFFYFSEPCSEPLNSVQLCFWLMPLDRHKTCCFLLRPAPQYASIHPDGSRIWSRRFSGQGRRL
jgi:hypothetical protein